MERSFYAEKNRGLVLEFRNSATHLLGDVQEEDCVGKTNRRDFLKNVGLGTLAAGAVITLPESGWVTASAAEADSQPLPSAEEKHFQCEVLVIGGGIAGCFAAIKARQQGAEVILVDKGFVGKSGLTPFATEYIDYNPATGGKLDDWLDYFSRQSEYVNNRYWSERVAIEGYARKQDMISWGVEFQQDSGPKRTGPAGIVGQLNYVHSIRDNAPSEKNHGLVMRRQALKEGVKIIDRVTVAELLKQNGRIVGAVGIPLDSYSTYTFAATTTILCVGACAYKPLGYPPLVTLTGDGEGMAYRAGAEILGKEFIDSHYVSPKYPSMIARRGLPPDLDEMLGKATHAQGIPTYSGLVNAEGKRLPPRPDGASTYLFSYLELEHEAHAGRAPLSVSTLTGEKVDVVGGAALGMSLRKADGLWPANNDCGSNLPGLYAAGDALGTMQNGAVYGFLGGSTAGSAVTGAIAGEAAAKESKKLGRIALDAGEVTRAQQAVHMPIQRKGGYSPQWVTQLLRNTMTPYFISFIKKADRLQATLTLLEFMQEHLVPGLIARDPHELRLAHETKNMVLSAEMRTRSAMFRTESRGNHYREDFPRRDDQNWLAWTKIRQEKGKMRMVKVEMPKEWRTDSSKPYEQRYPVRFPGE